MRDPVGWLQDGDPAIRWQVERDLLDASERAIERVRRRVSVEGWGARLLARQNEHGGWAAGKSADDGMYHPKWISTTYTMLLLRDLGVASTDPRPRRACRRLLDEGLRRDGGINYDFGSRGETCVTGMVLSILARFRHDDDRLHVLADHVLERQMPDGGWNCQRARGATHSSVHTTISVLEGLDAYERHRPRKVRSVRVATRRGREFLLAHRLFRSHRTGAVIKPVFLRFAFPPRWHYDVLRALDHFQAVGAPRDERLRDAIELLRRKRRPDGRWNLDHAYPGRVWFAMETVGRPSRWNTLRALRVLRWWEA